MNASEKQQALDLAKHIGPRVRKLVSNGMHPDAAIKQASMEWLDFLAELAVGETERAKAYREYAVSHLYHTARGEHSKAAALVCPLVLEA